MNFKRILFVGCICMFFLSSHLKAQQLEMDWAFLIETPGSSQSAIYKSALDNDGNIFVIGYFKDTIIFGSGNNRQQFVVNFPGKNEIFIAKYNKESDFLWARRFEQQENKEITGLGFEIVTDSEGDVYASGYFAGTVKFSQNSNSHIFTTPQTSFGTPFDNFIVKLDREGNFQWASHISKNLVSVAGYFLTATTHCYSLSICNQTGDLLIGALSQKTAAISSDTLYFGNIVSTTTGAHIGKINHETGAFIWVRTISDLGGGVAQVGAIANDALGNIYVSGAFRDSADFDMGTGSHILYPSPKSPSATAANFRNMYLAKYDIQGNLIWVKRFEGNYYANSSAMVLDDSANIHIVGNFVDSVDFDPDPNSNHILVGNGILNRYNPFVLKMDSAGNFIWAGQFKGANRVEGRDISLDAFGNVYTVGQYTGSTDFDPGPNNMGIRTTPSSAVHTWISKLNPTGEYEWVRTFGGSASSANGYTIAVDHSNNVYAGGSLSRSTDVDFNEGFLPPYLLSATATQGYLMKLSCTDTSTTAFSEVACNTYEFNGIVYDQTGFYTQKYWSMGGCDSIITLDLTVNYIEEPIITVDSFKLSVTGGSYTVFQWLKDGIEIPGAVDSILIVSENADYQVVVSNGSGCIDTSAVYRVTNVTAINDIDKINRDLHIYPNPVSDIVYINSPIEVNITLTNPEGRQLLQAKDANTLSLNELSAGIYFLHLTDKNGQLLKIEKIIKL